MSRNKRPRYAATGRTADACLCYEKGLANIELYDPEHFEEKYGIEVERFVDYKSLVGIAPTTFRVCRVLVQRQL